MACLPLPVFPDSGCSPVYLIQPSGTKFILQHLIGKVCTAAFREYGKNKWRGKKTRTDTILPVLHRLCKAFLHIRLQTPIHQPQCNRAHQLCLPVRIRRSFLQEQECIGFFCPVCVFLENLRVLRFSKLFCRLHHMLHRIMQISCGNLCLGNHPCTGVILRVLKFFRFQPFSQLYALFIDIFVERICLCLLPVFVSGVTNHEHCVITHHAVALF